MKTFNKNIAQRSLIGSIAFAMALWFYTSLNGSFSTFIEVPFSIKLPVHRALEYPIPKTISVEVTGTGWNLFNIFFFNNFKKIQVDLSRSRLSDSIYIISKNEIFKGAMFFEKVNLSMVKIDQLEIKTGSVSTYSIPMKSNIRILPKKGFSLVGDVMIAPERINITGNDKLLKNIKSWTTNYESFYGKNSSFSSWVNVSDSLRNMLSIDTKKVEIFAEIQQTAEIRFDDIEISYRGGALPKHHFIYPQVISIVVRGGINYITELSPDKISASLEFSKIMEDTTGILFPKIELPNRLEVIKVEPAYLYHYIKTKVERLPTARNDL